MRYTIIIGLIATVLFSGCARLNSIARDFNVNEGTGQLIDAKQRAIIVVKQKDTNKTIVCAEPSPDALSAYAMQMALEGKIPDGTALKLASSSQEGTSFIGLRTQSIQLLRDAMYRNCEAYANGAINEAEYGIASRRYQRRMVGLLAIEQLTGAIRVPPISITTEGTAEIAKSISEMQSEADLIDEEITQLTNKINDINTTLKTGDELITLNEKKTKLESQKSSKEKNKEAINKAIVNARSIMLTGKTYATVIDNGLIHRSDEHIEKVADTVYNIVNDLNNEDDFGQICISNIFNPKIDKEILEICKNKLNQINQLNELMLKKNQVEFEEKLKILNDPKSTQAQKNDAMKLLDRMLNDPKLKIKSQFYLKSPKE